MILVSISTVRWTLLHTFGMLHVNVWSIQIHLKVFLVETQHLTQQCFIQCRRPSSFATSTCCRPQVWEWQNYIKLQTSEWLPMMASGCDVRPGNCGNKLHSIYDLFLNSLGVSGRKNVIKWIQRKVPSHFYLCQLFCLDARWEFAVSFFVLLAQSV